MAAVVTALAKGQNAPLPTGAITLAVRFGAPADISALLVTEAGSVRSDADFVFFNQPRGPGVALAPAPGGGPDAVRVDPDGVPAEIATVRAVITLDDAGSSFGGFAPPVATVADERGNTLYEYRIEGLGPESVVIALEVYRRAGAWKVRAVGQGYAGGFAALVTDHGVAVDDEPVAEAAPPAAAPPAPVPTPDEPVVRVAPGEERLSFEKRQVLDLRKREVAKVLLTKGATQERARVLLVVDKTGSMHSLYRRGVVHRVVERMIAVATQLDDDGVLEPYLYARRFAKLPDIRVEHGEAWCAEYLHLSGVHGGIDYGPLGASNDELPIMTEILSGLSRGDGPTLVLFFTDGGFSQKAKIAALIREASALPAFWQFVGLGKANFGLLRTLDDLDGRVVDNAGFFAVDDIDRLDDAQLYHLLLSEFPDWLRAARAAGITR